MAGCKMSQLFVLKTTANREEQVIGFIESNVKRKGLEIYSLVNPEGMKGYILIEAETDEEAKKAFYNIPYAKGLLPRTLSFEELDPLLEQVKTQVPIKKDDIIEVISGPFKKEKAKVKRIDKEKEEVVVELLEAAIPIPITVKLDVIKLIRSGEEEVKEEKE